MPLLTCKKNSHSVLVSFAGDATVRTVARIKNGLARLLREQVEIYKLDISTVSDTDFTFIQLLIAFHFKLKAMNRELVLINCTDDSAFLQTASLCGINLRGILNFEEGGDGR